MQWHIATRWQANNAFRQGNRLAELIRTRILQGFSVNIVYPLALLS